MTGDNRERFKKELLRLKSYRCRAVIIEGTLRDIMIHRYLARTDPESVIGSLASWQTKYEIPFVLAGDADGAARYCLAVMRTFYRQCQEFAGNFAGLQLSPGDKLPKGKIGIEAMRPAIEGYSASGKRAGIVCP